MSKKLNLKINWKYALGEILLIFIGISLAIAFQNWYDNKKDKTQLNGYLMAIGNNLKTDISSIEHFGNLRKEESALGKKHMALFLNDSVSLEVFAQTSSILGESYLQLDQTGFESLKNSGYFSSLQGKTVEKALLEYYQLYNNIHEEEVSFNTFVENMEYRLYEIDTESLKGFFSAFYKFGNGSKNLTASEKKAVETAFTNSNVIGVMQRAADMNDSFLAKYDSLAAKAEKLQILIQEEVNH